MREGWRRISLEEVFEVDNAKLGEHDYEPVVLSLSKYDGFVRADEYFDKRIASEKLDGYKVVPVLGWAYSTIHIDEGSIARNNLYVGGVISPMYTTLRWRGVDHDPRYFELLVRSPKMLDEYRANAQGSINRRRSLPAKSFLALEIDAPPIAEQRRIVDLVGAVDEYVEACDARVEDGKQARAALLAELLGTGGDDWVETTLGAIASVKRGVSWSKEDEIWDRADDAHPVVRIGNVQLTGLDMTETLFVRNIKVKDVQNKSVGSETILMVGSNGNPDRVGNAHLASKALQGYLYASFLIGIDVEDETLSAFLLYLLQSREVQAAITEATSGSTGLKNIGLSWLRSLKFDLPPLAEQQRIVDIVGDLDEANVAAARTAATAREVRAGLLSELLSGEHEVPESYDDVLEAV